MTDRLVAAMAELVEALREEVAAQPQATPGPDPLLDVPTACAALGIGRSALYGLMASELRSIKVGRRRLIPAAAIRAFIEERAA